LVQIKTTFKESLTFKTCPDYYLGFKLYTDGRYVEVFNGPGRLIEQRYSERKGIGKKLLSFPIKELRALSAQVAAAGGVVRVGEGSADRPGAQVTDLDAASDSGRLSPGLFGQPEPVHLLVV